jgi:hypothetical protein
MPYYYQAAKELGAPASKLSHIENLLQHAQTYHLENYLPEGIDLAYTSETMDDVKQWTETESEGIMYIYGELDPWSAALFPYRTDADSYRLMVRNGNHGANITSLSTADRNQAVSILQRWLSRAPTQPRGRDSTVMSMVETNIDAEQTLEALEMKLKPRLLP